MNITTKHRLAIDNAIRRVIDAERIAMLRYVAENDDANGWIRVNSADNRMLDLIWRIQNECRSELKAPRKRKAKANA